MTFINRLVFMMCYAINQRGAQDTSFLELRIPTNYTRRKVMKKTSLKVLTTVITSMAMTGGMFSYAMPAKAFETSSVYGTTITQQTGSLTVQKTDSDKQPLAGATFSIYKVMSLTPGATAGNYTKFKIEDTFKDVLKDVTPDALGNYSTTALENLSKELSQTASSLIATKTGTSDASGNIEFKDLELGYYLVVETTAPTGYVTGKPFLVAIPSTNNYDNNQAGTDWIYEVKATPKNEQVSIDKKITNESDGSVKVGDFVQYQLTTKMPTYDDTFFGNQDHPATFEIIDTMDDGLAIQNSTEKPIKVMVGSQSISEGSDTYTVTAENKTGDAADMTISFKETFIKAHRGEDISVTYYAQVTDRAVQGQEGNKNEAYLRYDHKPGEIAESDKDSEKVFSFGIKVEKFTKEATNSKALSGAEFTLLGANGSDELGTAATNNQGVLNFELLDEGTYYLKETKSPAGYTLLADPIKVEITAETNANGKATGAFTLKVNDQEVTATSGDFTTKLDETSGTAIIAVENHKGFTLPSTGGEGITIFLAIGGLGILSISVVMMKKSKKQA